MTPSIRQDEIVPLLEHIKLFGMLATEDRAACAARFRELRFAKGEALFARGDLGRRLYIIWEGQVRLTTPTPTGREPSFEIASAGDLIGEIAWLDGLPQSLEATALAPSVVLSLERGDFERLRAARPAISDAVIAFLCQSLRDVGEKREAVALYPLEMRLARYLLTALRGARDAAGRRMPVELRYATGELALLLGASRPKIEAALAALEAAGAVGREADRLFCDRTKLTGIARWTGE